MTEPRFRLEIWSDHGQHGNREWVASTFDTWKNRAPWADTFDDYADALRFGMVMLDELYTKPPPLAEP